MSDRKQVRIGVDSTELESNFQRLKSRVDETAQELIRNARAYSSSSREVLQDIEEQIKAIERLNKAHAEERHYRLEERKERGEVSEKGYQSGIQKLEVESKEEKIQTQLLRELIREQRELAKEEIRERRTDVERELQQSKTVDQLSPDGDTFKNFKETLQRGMLGDIKTGEAIDRGGGVMGAMSGAAGIIGSDDPIAAGISSAGSAARSLTAGTNMAKGGIIAAIAAAILGGAYEMAEDYGRAAGDLVGSAGGTRLGWMDVAKRTNMYHYGYSGQDVIEAMPIIGAARGAADYSGQHTRNALMMQRGMGLDISETAGLERALRGDTSGYSTARGATQDLIRGMRRGGIMQGEDLTLLPEMMQQLVSISQEQLTRLGDIDVGMNTRMISAIASLDESFTNPQVLMGVVNKLQAGLSQAQTPQQQALQYSVLSRLRNTETGERLSMLEMEEIREAPFEHPEYMPEYFKALEGTSMGNFEQFVFNISEEFGYSKSVSRKLATAFQKEGTAEAITKALGDDAFKGVAGYDTEAGAKEATTVGQTAAAMTRLELERQLAGYRSLDGSTDSLVQASKNLEESARALEETGNAFDKILSIFVRIQNAGRRPL